MEVMQVYEDKIQSVGKKPLNHRGRMVLFDTPSGFWVVIVALEIHKPISVKVYCRILLSIMVIPFLHLVHVQSMLCRFTNLQVNNYVLCCFKQKTKTVTEHKGSTFVQHVNV